MTLPLARDLGKNGVRVCTIAPGTFETPMLAGLKPDIIQALEAVSRHDIFFVGGFFLPYIAGYGVLFSPVGTDLLWL